MFPTPFINQSLLFSILQEKGVSNPFYQPKSSLLYSSLGLGKTLLPPFINRSLLFSILR